MSVLSGSYDVTWKDYDGEESSVSFPVAALTAANFDAQEVLRAALQSALNAVLLGQVQSCEQSNTILDSVSASDDQTAQRELAIKVTYIDATAVKAHSTQIPTPDLANLDENNRAFFAIGDGDVIDAWIAAFEAYAISPAGNAVTVDEMQLKGRNL
jgi:hypothetical protein